MNFSRKCLPCTACCEGWLTINTPEVRTTLDNPCKFVTENGCSINETKPENPCKKFSCGWLDRDSPLPDWMRPDRSGAIILFDKMFWKGKPVIVTIATGANIPYKTIFEVKKLANLHSRNAIFFEYEKKLNIFTGKKKLLIHGEPLFTIDIKEKFLRGVQLF